MEAVALVLGGARGLGAAVVRAFAARGHAVAIHCHASLQEARSLADELTVAGGSALAVTANLREEGVVRTMVHRVADHFGRIDVVAVCSRLRRTGRLEELTGVDLARHYEVNVVGPFVAAQEAATVMLRQPTGGVIAALATKGDPAADELASAASQASIPALVRSLDHACVAHNPHVRAMCLLVAPPPPPPASLAALLLARIDEVLAAGA